MSDFSLSFSPKDLQNFQKVLGQNVSEQIINKALQTVNYRFDNQVALNLDKYVYSETPSPQYRRTGNLLGGRTVTRTKNQMLARVNPQLKGASRDYAMAVNNGHKKTKAKPFFTKTFDEIKEALPNILKPIINQFLKK
jgi:hypothetical protein